MTGLGSFSVVWTPDDQHLNLLQRYVSVTFSDSWRVTIKWSERLCRSRAKWVLVLYTNPWSEILKCIIYFLLWNSSSAQWSVDAAFFVMHSVRHTTFLWHSVGQSLYILYVCVNIRQENSVCVYKYSKSFLLHCELQLTAIIYIFFTFLSLFWACVGLFFFAPSHLRPVSF